MVDISNLILCVKLNTFCFTLLTKVAYLFCVALVHNIETWIDQSAHLQLFDETYRMCRLNLTSKCENMKQNLKWSVKMLNFLT